MHPHSSPFDNLAFKMDMEDLKRQMQDVKGWNKDGSFSQPFSSRGAFSDDSAPPRLPTPSAHLAASPRPPRRQRITPYSKSKPPMTSDAVTTGYQFHTLVRPDRPTRGIWSRLRSFPERLKKLDHNFNAGNKAFFYNRNHLPHHDSC
jgi:hypothetical protein